MSSSLPDVRSAQAHAAEARRASGGALTGEVMEMTETTAVAYAGLVTRAIAFAMDGAVINGAALLVGVVVGLGLSILHLPEEADVVVAAILGGLWVLWTIAYFTFFWCTTGQTPGDRVMRIRVLDSRGRGPLRPVRAMLRFGGLILAALPLLAGFLIMLWDDRRRCLQDRLARTVVVHAPVSGEARGAFRR